ncbi:M3 family metallopeptidase [Chitinimonas sp. BJYL2]|uniref:M3 family metallopeptidase n=1 Tax=Chitinimonas sp. BJYL2 TaxID=2976696 RepID=UPI0022B439E6|nr:M3 family metallopeptidase [Chitinimonas sp. BJYL2]
MRKLIPLALALSVSSAIAAERGAVRISPADQVPALCDQAIADIRQQADLIEKLPLEQATVDTVLVPWSQASGKLVEFWWGGGLIANTHPDAAIRQSEEACDLRVSEAVNRLMQREDLYKRFKALKPADAIDAETLKGVLLDFEERGVNLPKAKRTEVARLLARQEKLQQDFARNVRENKQRLAFSEAQLKGVPAETLATFKRNAQGQYLVGFDYPEYLPVMENAEDEAVRKALYVAYQRRGGAKNLALLREVTELRKRQATLMGYRSYAELATRSRMVGKPEVVADFLKQVKEKVNAVERSELAALRELKATHTGNPKAVLTRWDQLFYESRLKKSRYSLDQEVVRAQFPTEPTVAWMMAVTGKLYGVTFKPNTALATWHEDVKGYDVFDAASGEYLSSFYMDLFPRDGKYKHAAAFTVRQSSLKTGNTPISALVTNFSRAGFDQEELETLFHEFGHIMHGVLSRTRYTLNAGTNTKRDFVEAPSQMFEAWSRDPASLALWQASCGSCAPIDMSLVQKINAARAFGQGTKYARQWLYAAYDMALAGPIPQDPQKLWVKMEGETALGHVPGTQFPGAFGHIVGGYAAGYYGYMWSEVLALDMRSAFGTNLMNTDTGLRFRRTVLENGSQVPEMDLVRQFLGREPNSDAFFREITGQSNQEKQP